MWDTSIMYVLHYNCFLQNWMALFLSVFILGMFKWPVLDYLSLDNAKKNAWGWESYNGGVNLLISMIYAGRVGLLWGADPGKWVVTSNDMMIYYTLDTSLQLCRFAANGLKGTGCQGLNFKKFIVIVLFFCVLLVIPLFYKFCDLWGKIHEGCDHSPLNLKCCYVCIYFS